MKSAKPLLQITSYYVFLALLAGLLVHFFPALTQYSPIGGTENLSTGIGEFVSGKAKPINVDSFIGDVPGITDAFVALFAASSYDGVSAATPLDLFRQNSGMMFDGLMTSKAEMAGVIAGRGWDMVNLAFLAGGLWLLRQRIFTWHAPIGMLAALSVCALIGFDEGSSTGGGSILFHLFSGATMFGAFFIITDPVSSAVSNKGRLVFGALVGVLVYLIRVYGNYPDALAFGVLLMNFAAPLIDQYTQPAVYGTKKIEVDE